jgi:hypothetical protein
MRGIFSSGVRVGEKLSSRQSGEGEATDMSEKANERSRDILEAEGSLQILSGNPDTDPVLVQHLDE